MDEYKPIVDVLSSLASLVTISVFFGSWINSLRKALSIKRIVIHRKKEYSTYILEVKNRKEFPVEIKNIRCFTGYEYNVEQRSGDKPKYFKSMSLDLSAFITNEKFQIEASCFTDIHIKGNFLSEQPKQLIFSMDTSHGYHLLQCSNIDSYDIGNTETFSMEHKNIHSSKKSAIWQYVKLKIRYVFTCNRATSKSR